MTRHLPKAFRLHERICSLASALICGLAAAPALACNGAEYIRLTQPVEISPEQRAMFSSLPPLRVVAVDSPPLAQYVPERQAYEGVGIDVLCFISRELGIQYAVAPGRDETAAAKIRKVQEGNADLFISLSHSPERAVHGLFTLPYYESHYAVIARHDAPAVSIRSLDELADYRVAYVKGVSFEPLLQRIVPAGQLLAYDQTTSDGLFQAAVDGTVDVVVFNKDIFIEKRYRQEFFDLDIALTLSDHPRGYRFYFSQSPEHVQLVQAFDRYLEAIDLSRSISRHEVGERHFLERYIAQREQRAIMQVAIGAALLLTVVFFLAFLHYRRLTGQLTERSLRVQQQQQDLQAAYLKLEALSLTDSLTGLSNRRQFDQMLRYEYTRRQRTGSPLSLLVIDVDHFKKVNDQYGHATGDSYLRTIAQVLESTAARSTDLVARYGGEEFACLLPDTPANEAYALAERIQQGIAGQKLPNALAAPPVLTLSIGIATLMQGDPGAQQLFELADTQLYAAKKAGRNRICATRIEH